MQNKTGYIFPTELDAYTSRQEEINVRQKKERKANK
jgi:hypothetical protein